MKPADICNFIGVDIPDNIDYTARNVSLDKDKIDTVLKLNKISNTDLNDGFVPKKIRNLFYDILCKV